MLTDLTIILKFMLMKQSVEKITMGEEMKNAFMINGIKFKE